MKLIDKINCCFLVCFMAFILSLIGLMINGQDVTQAVEEIEILRSEIIFQNKKIEEQNKQIEFYKQYVDDVARCIVDGEW